MDEATVMLLLSLAAENHLAVCPVQPCPDLSASGNVFRMSVSAFGAMQPAKCFRLLNVIIHWRGNGPPQERFSIFHLLSRDFVCSLKRLGSRLTFTRIHNSGSTA